MNLWIQEHIQSVVSFNNSVTTPDFTTNSAVSKSNENKILKPKIIGSYKYNFHGILLPFERNGGDDINPYIMLRILPELN